MQKKNSNDIVFESLEELKMKYCLGRMDVSLEQKDVERTVSFILKGGEDPVIERVRIYFDYVERNGHVFPEAARIRKREFDNVMNKFLVVSAKQFQKVS